MTVRYGCGKLFHFSPKLAQVITGDFATSRSVLYMACTTHVVTGVSCSDVSICDASVFTVLSSRLGIVLNPCAGAITDHSQLAKDTDPYFKFQLYVEDPGNRKLVLILPNGLSKPRERAHDSTFYFCHGRNSNSQHPDWQSSVLLLSYHRSHI